MNDQEKREAVRSKVTALIEWSRLNRAAVSGYARIAQAFAGFFLIVFSYSIGKTDWWLNRSGLKAQGTIICIGWQVPVLDDQNDPTVAEINRPIATDLLLGAMILGIFLILAAIRGGGEVPTAPIVSD